MEQHILLAHWTSDLGVFAGCLPYVSHATKNICWTSDFLVTAISLSSPHLWTTLYGLGIGPTLPSYNPRMNCMPGAIHILIVYGGNWSKDSWNRILELAAVSIPNASILKPAPKCSFFVAKIKQERRIFFFWLAWKLNCNLPFYSKNVLGRL